MGGSFNSKVIKEDAVETIPIDEKVTEKQKKFDNELDTEGQFVNADGGLLEDEDDDDIGIDEEERGEIRQEASKEFEKVSQGKENVDLDGFKDIVTGLKWNMKESSIEREFDKLVANSNVKLLSRSVVETWHVNRMTKDED